MNPLTERAVGLLGLSTPATRAIRATFDRMEVAEAAIRQMKVPDNGRAVFGALVPMMEAMTKVALWVYRAHAVELCGRYMDGGEAKLATKDEIMLALHESSLKAPLNDQGMACYAATFLYCAHVSPEPARHRLHD